MTSVIIENRKENYKLYTNEKFFLKEQIPFNKYFQVAPLKNYTKVILMDTFMKHLADKVWPKGKRTGFADLLKNFIS